MIRSEPCNTDIQGRGKPIAKEEPQHVSQEDLRTILTRPIAFHRLFAAIAGSVGGGVFLSQLYYWTERTDDPDGWIYKTAEEWYDETMLTRRELDSIRKALKDKGVVKEKLAGVPATVHYKIEWNELFDGLKAAAHAHRDWINQRREKQFGGKRQTTLRSETSSEITTENTTTTRDSRSVAKNITGAAHDKESSLSFAFSEEEGEAKTKSVEAATNGVRVALVTSLASEQDSARELADKIAIKCGLSDSQRHKVELHIAQGPDARAYVLQCEELARSKPTDNMGRAFMAAFRDGWKKPVSTVNPQPATQPRRRQDEPEPQELLSFEKRSTLLAEMKSKVNV
jgi:hypothetical protein